MLGTDLAPIGSVGWHCHPNSCVRQYPEVEFPVELRALFPRRVRGPYMRGRLLSGPHIDLHEVAQRLLAGMPDSCQAEMRGVVACSAQHQQAAKMLHVSVNSGLVI